MAGSLRIHRGLPGSGKKEAAMSLATLGFSYFTMENGETTLYRRSRGHYRVVKGSRLSLFEAVHKALDRNLDVVIAGIFPTNRQLKPYVELAMFHDNPVDIVTFTQRDVSKQTINPVDIEAAKKYWEEITVQALIDECYEDRLAFWLNSHRLPIIDLEHSSG